MRKLLKAIFALVAASSLVTPVCVFAQDDGVEMMMKPDRELTRAARLRTEIKPGDPDTVWIGHIYDVTYTAGGTMTAGGYGPYKVGRGPNFVTRFGAPPNATAPLGQGSNGTWDFDRFQFTENDSLQGWWPLARPYQSGATTFGDFTRPFFGLDYGNQANYVINQGSPKRTFGVVGVWHRDRGSLTTFAASDSIPGTNVQPVLWSPVEIGGTGSTASAWMGIRSHGDLSHVDLVANGGTGNPFNDQPYEYVGNNGFNAAGSVATNGTDHNFPGYASQMDQMLYRDIQLAEGDGLNISFNFETNMSLSKNTTPGQTIGWFDKDPISNAAVGTGSTATPTSDGNFISASVISANAPCDSFMVYIGAPVRDNNVVFSAPLFVGGNEITTVYDPKRRWFSEVLRCTAGDQISGRPRYKELASYAGVNAVTNVSVNVGALYGQVLQDIKDSDGTTGNGGVVRLVFRVKTNRGYDDQNGGNPSAAYNSTTRGAAILDNVVVNGWAAANGDFEATNSINNDTAVSPLNAWKSTGKPAAAYFHTHSVMPGQGLVFNDPCGGLDNPNRACNMYGKVLTGGDHDAAEKDGGLFGSNTQDRYRWIGSPTVNLRSTGNGPGFYNAMGIDDEIARTTFDYACFVDLYDAGLVDAPTATGNFFALAFQSYPARQANGNICWGEVRHGPSIFFSSPPQSCSNFFLPITSSSIGAKSTSLIRTTNAQNRPDSMRVFIARISRCYSFGLTEGSCSPTTGNNVGVYIDNVSLALIDGGAPIPINIAIWDLINDAFPINNNAGLIPAGFDTCAAQIRTGFNTATSTLSLARDAIGGDSVLVIGGGDDVRMDMVFRILPGPGNYMTKGVKASGVSKRPDGKPYAAGVPAYVKATPGDGSFWGEYMSNNGQFGSSPGHGTQWSQQVWNSARMDTMERNLFPTANNGSAVALTPGTWCSMYHESDPHFSTLGITKNRCVMPIPTGSTGSDNMDCSGTGWIAYGAGSGWDGVTTTKEYTKIIPDGLLTPGSHVQYFFRKGVASTGVSLGIGPDTSFINQGSEGSFDAHRWQQFGVLPDRWKDGAWSAADRNAPAPACMIYVDWADRRFGERYWVSTADSMGATSSERWGAHNGWHAKGGQEPNPYGQDLNVVIGTANDWGVYRHGGQPGTIWDMFGVKASESSSTSMSLGSRSHENAPSGYRTGKGNKNAPTGDMLRNYYRFMLALTADITGGNIGPFTDKGDDDVALITDFANTVGGTSLPRGLWFQGDGFVEGQAAAGGVHLTLINTVFGTGLSTGDYRATSGNTNDFVDMTPSAPVGNPANKYGVTNSCVSSNDVLTTVGTGTKVLEYPAVGGTRIASVYSPSSLPGTTHPSVTLVDGFQTQQIRTWMTATSQGRIDYFYTVLTNLFGAVNCALGSGQPVSVGETPNPGLVYFLALRSENPFRDGSAKITFGITKKERVELKVYDVTGRLVKTLANREFSAGEHNLFWDGSNDDGQLVSRGVYFYQLRTPSFVSQKKLAVLKN